MQNNGTQLENGIQLENRFQLGCPLLLVQHLLFKPKLEHVRLLYAGGTITLPIHMIPVIGIMCRRYNITANPYDSPIKMIAAEIGTMRIPSATLRTIHQTLLMRVRQWTTNRSLLARTPWHPRSSPRKHGHVTDACKDLLRSRSRLVADKGHGDEKLVQVALRRLADRSRQSIRETTDAGTVVPCDGDRVDGVAHLAAL